MTAATSDQTTVPKRTPGLPFSPVRRAGDWIAVSGQLGLRDGQLVPGGAGAETARALENLRSVLERAGASLGAVQKVNVYMNSMACYADMNASYAQAFADLPLPARTAVAVLALPRDASVEVEAWAYVPTNDGDTK